MSPGISEEVEFQVWFEFDEGRQWVRFEGESVEAWIRSTESVKITDIQ